MPADAIYRRRSIRKFQDRPVPPALIRELIRAAGAAPSAKNRQPWKYLVFGNGQKDALLRAMEAGLSREERGETALPGSRSGLPDARNTLRVMGEAPVIIMILNTNAGSVFLPVDSDKRLTELCDSLSIGASVENLLLTAQSLGLGALWIANTCFAYPELTAYLETEKQLVGAIAVGYPGEDPAPRPRKTLEEIAEYRL